MATTRRTTSAAKKAPAAKKASPRAVVRRPFELVGPIHWAYPFTVALSGTAKREVTDFLTRFTTVAKLGDVSGYVVHDDDDLDASSWTFDGQVDWEGATFLRGVTHLRLDGLPGDQYGPLLACGHLDALEELVLGGAYAAHDAAADALCRATSPCRG